MSGTRDKGLAYAQKHSAHAGIALVAGDQPIGFLGIALR